METSGAAFFLVGSIAMALIWIIRRRMPEASRVDRKTSRSTRTTSEALWKVIFNRLSRIYGSILDAQGGQDGIPTPNITGEGVGRKSENDKTPPLDAFIALSS